MVSGQQARVPAVLQARQDVRTRELAVDVGFQRGQVVPRVLHRVGGDEVGYDVQEPPVIAHQRGVRLPDAVEVRGFGHEYGSDRPAFPVPEPEVVGGPHPVLGSRVDGLGQSHDGDRNVLGSLGFVALEHHQPGLFAHSPAQQARGVHAHHALNLGASSQIRAAVGIHDYRIRRPATLDQRGVFRESGDEEGTSQGNVVHAVRRTHLGQGQRGQHLGVTVYVPQQVAHVSRDDALNIRT